MANTRSNAEDVVVDVADVSPRQVTSAGKKIKAVPSFNATTVVVRGVDFASASAGKIEHPDVTWDFRVDDFTVTVGKEITSEAADFLVKNYSDSFHYVGE